MKSFISNKIELKQSKFGKSLFARVGFQKNELILEFEKNFLQDANTHTSLQINEHLHQQSTDPNAIENFINHSCDPNGYIDFENLSFHALRDIKKGEELTFNYNSSEWEISLPVDCGCNATNCIRKIKGFKHLSLAQREEIQELISPFLRKKSAQD